MVTRGGRGGGGVQPGGTRETFRGEGKKERESRRGRWEEVSKGTRDGWVETKGMGENVRCRYERQEEVEWEKFHVKLCEIW